MPPLLVKLVRFSVVGGLCALLFFLIHYSLTTIFSVSLMPSLITTYAICFGIGYSLQRNFAFRSTTQHRRSLPRYFILHFCGLLFVYYLTRWMESHFLLGNMGASLVATGIAGLVSFVISLTWIFQTQNLNRAG